VLLEELLDPDEPALVEDPEEPAPEEVLDPDEEPELPELDELELDSSTSRILIMKVWDVDS
tara:strand:+ start:239 stop:421 length:183 start_codon:yes stop_codon:yes gene_type:complete